MKNRTLRFVMSVALASTLLLGGCAKEKEVPVAPVETPEENT